MALHLLHGDSKSTDPYLIKKRLDELLKGIQREGNLNFATFDLSESGTAFTEIVTSALTIPFLGGQRVVVARSVKSVETAFKSLDDPDDDRKSKRGGTAEVILRAVEQLSELPDDALLILVEENDHLDGRTAFYRGLKKAGCIIEAFKGMWFDPVSSERRDRGQVVEFVQAEASKRGLRLDAGKAEHFALLVGSDRGTIIQELEKLAAYAGAGSRITDEDIKSVVTESYEAGIFHLVDTVGFGKTGEAFKVLGDILDRGAAPPYILAMIARQVRLIARVREALDAGASSDPRVLAGELKEAPFTITKVLKQIRSFPRFSYASVLEKLMTADVHMKRGTMPPKLALETLIAQLAGSSERAHPHN